MYRYINFNPLNIQTPSLKAASTGEGQLWTRPIDWDQLLDIGIMDLFLETRVLGEKWIWTTSIIRNVGENKPLFTVVIVACRLQQLI